MNAGDTKNIALLCNQRKYEWLTHAWACDYDYPKCYIDGLYLGITVTRGEYQLFMVAMDLLYAASDKPIMQSKGELS